VLDWIGKNVENVSKRRMSPIHLDDDFANVLISNEGRPFVIEWTKFDIMDFRLDLAWTLLLVSTYGHPEVRDYILGTYEDIVGNVQDIEYFEALAAARRLYAIFMSLKMGPEKLGMRPEATEMMKQGDHIKRVVEVLRDRTGITFRGFDELLKT